MKIKLLVITFLALFFCSSAVFADDVYMKAQSDHRPDDIIECKNKSIVNFNIVEKEITEDGKTRTIYEYDYVMLDGKATKTKFKEAIEEAEKEAWKPDKVVLEHKLQKDK